MWKDKVYQQLVDEFDIKGLTWEQLLQDYISQFKDSCVPFPNLITTLENLINNNITLGMITNGKGQFQMNNIKALGIDQYFKTILTISAGGVSSLNAMYFANNLIKQGICDQVVVVSSDEFNEPILAGMERIPKYLTDKHPKAFASDRDGYLLGEAGVAYVVESEESAKDRNASIMAEIKGFGLTADQVGNGRINPKGESWKKALEYALVDAELTASEIDFIASAAGGHGKFDEVEANVLKDVFSNQVSVGATKSIFGETNGSSGFIGLLSGIMALKGVKPAIRNVKESEVDLDLVLETRYEEEAKNVIINSFSYGGNYNSLIIGKYE